METNHRPEKIEAILSEADELLDQLNSGLIEDMDETLRTQIEIHADELKKQRLALQESIEKGERADAGSFSEGIHKAIDDIVTAMKALTRYLT